RGVVVREWQIYKVPVLVSCEVIVADVLASSGVVGRTIAVVGSVRMVVGIFLDSVRPRRGDHKDHHFLFRGGRGHGNQVKPIVPIRVQQQQSVHTVFGRLSQLLVGNGGHHHVPPPVPRQRILRNQ